VNQSAAPVLHVDFVVLQESVGSDEVDDLCREAAALEDLNGVQRIGLISAGFGADSDFDLAFLFLLDGLANLEGFGTDTRYIRFLQGGLAQAMKSFGGADIQLLGSFERSGAFAGCVALAGTPQTYDWQVRDALGAWDPEASVGLAVGERQRYRGVGVLFSNQPVARPAEGFEGLGVDFVTGAYQLLA
jgi:hypothetical protein